MRARAAIRQTLARTFGSLDSYNYRVYFAGDAISFIGAWMQTMAEAWLVLELTDSGAAVGATFAFRFLPVALFGLWGGAIADRFDRRRVLLVTQTCAAVLAIVLWLVVLTDVVQVWMVFGLAIALGFVTVFDEPVKKIVAVMQADEFRSTWVANKAVYRTRMAMADGGELLILAPGLERFGEQDDVDAFIRKYGYCGTPKCMNMYKDNADMQDLAHATAHLLHGSSEGRFTIRYAPGHLTADEIEGVNFEYADLKEMLKRYDPAKMKEGWNTMPDGERVYFISTPSAGLWATRAKLGDR